MHGATVGLGAIAAVQSIAVIDGMPTIWGDGALSIVERSGLLESMLEEYRSDSEEGLAAICTMRRRRHADADHESVLDGDSRAGASDPQGGPWQSYPQRMLKMRARSWTIRDGAADVLRGLHIREEVDDFAGGLWPQLLAAAQEGARGGPRPNGAARPRRTLLEPKEDIVAARAEAPGGGADGQQSGSTDAGALAAPPHFETAASVSAESEAAVLGTKAAISKTAAVSSASAEPETPAASTSVEPPTAAESFTLADADGGFLDPVSGAEALQRRVRAAVLQPHLSPDQISACGVEQSGAGGDQRGCMAGRYWRRLRSALEAARQEQAQQRKYRVSANGDGDALSTPRSRSQWPVG